MFNLAFCTLGIPCCYHCCIEPNVDMQNIQASERGNYRDLWIYVWKRMFMYFD